jgi:hypothetical protein
MNLIIFFFFVKDPCATEHKKQPGRKRKIKLHEDESNESKETEMQLFPGNIETGIPYPYKYYSCISCKITWYPYHKRCENLKLPLDLLLFKKY